MNGLLLVDKPLAWTSHDVVAFIRRQFRLDKVGHAGTLDPLATGLLLVLIGNATKRQDSLMSLDKTYDCMLTLGMRTDTQDLEGRVIKSGSWHDIASERITSTLLSFKGDLSQVPPKFSAVKVGGKKMCDTARLGKDIEIKSRNVKIYAIKIAHIHSPDVYFSVRCSKGTYIRTLCDDLGTKLDCPAVLSGLRRREIGFYNVQDALTPQALNTMSAADLAKRLIQTQ